MSTVHGITAPPLPHNEPVLGYGPKSAERAELQAKLSELAGTPREMPLVIGGEEVRTKQHLEVRSPHNTQAVLGTLFHGGETEVLRAVDAALAAKADWAAMSYDDRAAVFLRAADMLAGRYRSTANAATMLGQSKTVVQAEIDSACELIDFWRFNVHFGRQLMVDQPRSSAGLWNRVDYRPLDGFVLAVTPFNFTAIAGNLPTAPALMGNTVVWKPAATQAYSAQVLMDLLIEAGLPPGVINLVHCPGRLISATALQHRALSGVHFTGSTATFQSMWRTVGERISSYTSYPRLVGETGGKDFILAHPSADVETLAVAMVRGAFEYQGQKCSAASRAYVPRGLWPALRERVRALLEPLTMGDVSDFRHFMGAVIDASSFAKLKDTIDKANADAQCTLVTGGKCDDSQGYFVAPTLFEVSDPNHVLMREEFFGPILAVYPYDDGQYVETLQLCDQTSPYALTGAVFARDRKAITQAQQALRFAAGNFYINDKPTGAVVGQQPFGGGRASGTNDKAGSVLNLVRWISARSIKETFDGPRAVAYPHMHQ